MADGKPVPDHSLPARVPGPAVPGYRLGPVLGRGATGSVHSATRIRDGRRFAVKVVAASDGAMQALREHGVLSAFESPHVVRLEESLPLDDGAVALVLQLAEGGSLAQLVATRGHLSAGETVTVLAPLAGALADLHAAGVVHSDLSPPNVLFTATGMPLLSDLGVARLIGELPDHQFGTPGFVAPELERRVDHASAGGIDDERARGSAGDQIPTAASDVYALGALGWFALTGAPPPAFTPGRSLRAMAPQATPALVRVIETCMAAEPAGRPAAGHAAVAFYDSAPPEPVQLAAGADPAAALTHRLRAEAARQEPAAPSRRSWWRRRSAVLTAVLTVIALGAVAALAATRFGATGPSPSRPAPAAGPADVTRSRSAASTEPTALVSELARRRATALLARDVAGLRRVDVEDSAAWTADSAIIGQLVALEAHYAGLTASARSASLVGHESGSGAVVRATIESSSYTYRRGTAAPQTRRGSVGTVQVHLRWTSAGWRVESIS